MIKHVVALVMGVFVWGVDLQYWQQMLVGFAFALLYLVFMYWMIFHWRLVSVREPGGNDGE